MNKFQDIAIKHMDNGLKVKVGCMKLVYQQKDLKQFFSDLEAYFNDPERTERMIRKRWNLKATNEEGEGMSVRTTWSTDGLVTVDNQD